MISIDDFQCVSEVFSFEYHRGGPVLSSANQFCSGLPYDLIDLNYRIEFASMMMMMMMMIYAWPGERKGREETKTEKIKMSKLIGS